MATGIVEWLNPTKGYESIRPSSGGKHVFVYISSANRCIGALSTSENASAVVQINNFIYFAPGGVS